VLACHEGKKPFKCHLCNIGFSQRGNLKSHIVKVHIPSGENERVFKCHECACVYRRLATLNHHISRVHAVTSSDLPQYAEHTPLNPPEETIQNQTPDANIVPALLPNETVAAQTAPFQQQVQPQNVHAITNPDGTGTSEAPPAVATIQEVNCVYGDSGGTHRRCLLKVKKVGQLKYHLCPACPKSFRKPSDLIRHIRTHTLERPYLVRSLFHSFLKIDSLYTNIICCFSVLPF